MFNAISGHEDTEASRHLLSLVRSHRLAGLLMVDADMFRDTPLLDERIALLEHYKPAIPAPLRIACPE